MRARTIILAALAASLLMPAAAGAADAALVAVAKREGQVVWYTSLIVNQAVRPLAKAFEDKYGVQVRYARADSGPTALKILNEARAGRLQADVFDGTATAPAVADVLHAIRPRHFGSSRPSSVRGAMPRGTRLVLMPGVRK